MAEAVPAVKSELVSELVNATGLSEDDIREVMYFKEPLDPDWIEQVNLNELHHSFGPNQ